MKKFEGVYFSRASSELLDKAAKEGINIKDSNAIDAIVGKLKRNEGERGPLVKELLMRINKLMKYAVDKFYGKFQNYLEGASVEDVYNAAVEILLDKYHKWDDQQTRQFQGKQAAGFNTYFFACLPGYLREYYKLRTAKKDKDTTDAEWEKIRFEKTAEKWAHKKSTSLDEVVTNNATADFLESIINRVDKEKLRLAVHKLFAKNPKVATALVLRFNLEKDYPEFLDEKNNLAAPKKLNSAELGEERTLKEVGEIMGVSRERVRQIEIIAKKFLQEELKHN